MIAEKSINKVTVEDMAKKNLLKNLPHHVDTARKYITEVTDDLAMYVRDDGMFLDKQVKAMKEYALDGWQDVMYRINRDINSVDEMDEEINVAVDETLNEMKVIKVAITAISAGNFTTESDRIDTGVDDSSTENKDTDIVVDSGVVIVNATETKSIVIPVENMTHYVDDFIACVKGKVNSESTVNNYYKDVKKFLRWLAANGIQYPTRGDVIAYRDSLRARGLKSTTIQLYMISVKKFFEWMENGGYYKNMARNIKTPWITTDHKKGTLDSEGVVAIQNSILAITGEKVRQASDADRDSLGKKERAIIQGKRLYAMYLLSVISGLRTVEIHRANVEDVVVVKGQAYIYIRGKGRTNKDQKKALCEAEFDAIMDYLQDRGKVSGTDPLFVSTGNRSSGRRIAATTISTMLKTPSTIAID